MKKQIENLIFTVLMNEDFNYETITVDGENIMVDVTKCSLDSRGECYMLKVNTAKTHFYTIEHYGSRHYIKKILTQWLNGERKLVLFTEYGLKTRPMLVKQY